MAKTAEISEDCASWRPRLGREIHAWIDGRRGTPIRFPVLLDQRKRLAKAVDVAYYPTYIYFDVGGNEIDRSYSIKNISKWHNTRWLRKSGATP